MKFTKDIIKLDCEKTVNKLVEKMKQQVYVDLNRHGAVIGTSGGIDSAVVAALSAKAFGHERVYGVMLPDKDSSPDSKNLAVELADTYGYKYEVDDVTDALVGAGCYKFRDEAFRQVFPEWKDGWKAKIVLPTNILESNRLNIYRLAIESPDGEKMEKRLPLKAYLQIVAASNMKQRIRMLTLYYHAERLNYAVMGTGNKNEHKQGFFVKYGDGGADTKPIAHLFKTQVFQIAEYLGVPSGIRERTPTTDTYPSEQTQEEFFFGLKFQIMDLLWIGKEKGFSAIEIADGMGLKPEQVERVWKDIDQKEKTTNYLRAQPLEIE